VIVGVLSGEPRQGRVGVGWATVFRLDAAPAADPSLAVKDLDRLIDEVGATSGAGSAGRRADLLRAFLERATEPEQELVRRLFVGELRQGALEGLVADAVARAYDVPAAVLRRAWMLDGDLGRVALVAHAGGRAGLEAIGLTVLQPVRPMLAATSESVAAALGELGTASVEWKLDGARIQVHRNGDEVRVFTRNLNDVTHRVPEVVTVARTLAATRFVLDGETLALGDDESPDAFQDTMSRFGRDDGVTGAELRPFFFDCLHVDGEDLLDRPLVERLAALTRVAGDHRVPGVVTDDVARAEGVLDTSLATGHEGVMVKAADSLYVAGRRGKTWRKVKPVRTLDLVVIAVEWGHGRRHGRLSNLHLGARDLDGGFVMVGKTFKGMTDELLAWQTEQLLARETHRDGIVVHVRPELVVEIALDGVQASTRYSGGVALRFARVKGYRPDKSPADADTIDTVRAMLPNGRRG
jgi:DNA ligase-1